MSEEPRRRRRSREEQSPQPETNVYTEPTTEPTVQNTDRLTRRPKRSDYPAALVQNVAQPVQGPDVYPASPVQYADPPVRQPDAYPVQPAQYGTPPVQKPDVYPMHPSQYSTPPVQRPERSVAQSLKYTPPRTVVIRNTDSVRNTSPARDPDAVIRDEYPDQDRGVKPKKKRSVLILISAIIGSLYMAYIISYFGGVDYDSASAGEAIGYGIATALVMPHMAMAGLAVVFNWIGYFTRARGLVLTGAILYCVAAAAFPM